MLDPRSGRTPIRIARADVIDAVSIGAMWIVRTRERILVAHRSWYLELSGPDIATIRELLLHGWRKTEVADRYGVSEHAIARLFVDDTEVTKSRPGRRKSKPRRLRANSSQPGLQ